MFIDLEQLINLTAVQGIGPTRLRALMAHFRSTENIFKAPIKELTSIDGVDYKTAKNILCYSDFKFGEQQNKKAKNDGVSRKFKTNIRPSCLYLC